MHSLENEIDGDVLIKQLFEELNAYYDSLKTNGFGKKHSAPTKRLVTTQYVFGWHYGDSIRDGLFANDLRSNMRGENKKQSTEKLEAAMRKANKQEKSEVSIFE